ncbi:family 78 glycoside hydrolase catalytic domain [Niabella hirudinis]|uniref:family 78 glycoside hydrolase catalytic domain n=1 Tax=Niabella hirudinis TaxID=1285929 RepID=UPI003EBB92B7
MRKILLILIAECCWFTGLQAQVLDLKCENRTAPIGIDAPEPLFTWKLRSAAPGLLQEAFEVWVSDDQHKLRAGAGNIWQSGKITSGYNGIRLPAQKLKPFKKYYWKVRCYTNKGAASDATGTFETAMLAPGHWKARWIADRPDENRVDQRAINGAMPLFRKPFVLKKAVQSGRLYISGLGYYEVELNGKRVGKNMLDPGWTDYRKQVLYTTYDVSALVKKGRNALGVMLGNGWYDLSPMNMWCNPDRNLRKHLYMGTPCVKAQLRITYIDGKSEDIYTDGSWTTFPGPVLDNNIYIGEVYNANLEQPGWSLPSFKSSDAKQAIEIAGPPGAMVAQAQPPIQVYRSLKPRSVREVRPGVFLADLGQNFAGKLKIRVRGKEGDTVSIRYGEALYPDGSLNVMTSVAGQIKGAGCAGPGAPDTAYQKDVYILKGRQVEEWAPGFTFHGFRYAEISGWPGTPGPGDLEGLCLSAAVDNAGDFNSSDPMLNQLNENIRWTFRSNMFSTQSDCPAREKYGYGGDMLCTSAAFMYNFDMQEFYKKMLRDFTDAQRPLGGITETAPDVGIADFSLGDGSGPVSFQAGYTFLANELFLFYGDTGIIRSHYPYLKKQAAFLVSVSKEHLLHTDISDHESLDAKPGAFSASCFYFFHLVRMAGYAQLLEKAEDLNYFTRLAAQVKKAILEKYFNAQTGQFDNGTQSAQVYGLWFGLLDDAPSAKEKALNGLRKAIREKDFHLSTGIFGTKMLLDVLDAQNENALAYKIVTQPDYPGWMYMIRNGATSLWETWKYSDNTYSQDHPMFGSVMAWFYKSLAGIRPAAAGFRKIVIKPFVNNGLSQVKCDYRSPQGLIRSGWKKEGTLVRFQISVPANTEAEIWIPAKDRTAVRSGNLSLDQDPAVRFLKQSEGYQVLSVPAGDYVFTAAL